MDAVPSAGRGNEKGKKKKKRSSSSSLAFRRKKKKKDLGDSFFLEKSLRRESELRPPPQNDGRVGSQKGKRVLRFCSLPYNVTQEKEGKKDLSLEGWSFKKKEKNLVIVYSSLKKRKKKGGKGTNSFPSKNLWHPSRVRRPKKKKKKGGNGMARPPVDEKKKRVKVGRGASQAAEGEKRNASPRRPCSREGVKPLGGGEEKT